MKAEGLGNLARVMALLLAVGTGVAGADEGALSQAQAAVTSAQGAMAGGDWGKAVGLLQGAAGQEPEWLTPHEWLAVAYQGAGDEARAREEYVALQRRTGEWTLAGRCNPADVRDDVLQGEAEAALLINRVRLAQKLRPLRPDPRLAICAREHSLEMRDGGFCEHFSPTPGCRAAFDRFRLLFGYLPVFIAENLARIESGRGERGMVERVTETRVKLMASSGHRRNTLLPNATAVGVGLAVTTDGTFWITEVFAQETSGTGTGTAAGAADAAGGEVESMAVGASE